MAVSLVEVISMVPKSQEASMQKSNEMQKVTSEQVSFVQKFNDQKKHETESTQAADKSENAAYRYDAKEKGNNSYYAQQKKKDKKDKNTKDNDKLKNQGLRPGGIDIRI